MVRILRVIILFYHIKIIFNFFNKIEPYATGSVYVNFMTEEEVERIPSAYGTNQTKLEQVKRKYDPDNFFRVNQNIKPAAWPAF